MVTRKALLPVLILIKSVDRALVFACRESRGGTWAGCDRNAQTWQSCLRANSEHRTPRQRGTRCTRRNAGTRRSSGTLEIRYASASVFTAIIEYVDSALADTGRSRCIFLSCAPVGTPAARPYKRKTVCRRRRTYKIAGRRVAEAARSRRSCEKGQSDVPRHDGGRPIDRPTDAILNFKSLRSGHATFSRRE